MNGFVWVILIAGVWFAAYKVYFQEYFLKKKRGYFTYLSEKTGLDYLEEKSFFGAKHELGGMKGDYFFRIFQKTHGSGDDSDEYCHILVEAVQFGTSFKIKKENFIKRIAKKMGFNDIEFGYPELDDKFNFKAGDEFQFKGFITNEIQADLIRFSSRFNGVLEFGIGTFEYVTKGKVKENKISEELTALVIIMDKLLKAGAKK